MKIYFNTQTDAVDSVDWENPNLHSTSFMDDSHKCNCEELRPGFYIYNRQGNLMNEFIVCSKCFKL